MHEIPYDVPHNLRLHMYTVEKCVISVALHTRAMVPNQINGITDFLWTESTGHRLIPLAKARNADHWVFPVVSMGRLLNKQSKCQWRKPPWRSCEATMRQRCKGGYWKQWFYWLWQPNLQLKQHIMGLIGSFDAAGTNQEDDVYWFLNNTYVWTRHGEAQRISWSQR